jgi:hypothetical protein
MSLQQPSHDEGRGCLYMGIIAALLLLTLIAGESETAETGEGVVHCLRSVL